MSTERNLSFEVRNVNVWDGDGLWVTVFDSEGMEVEITLTGFTPERADAWRAGSTWQQVTR